MLRLRARAVMQTGLIVIPLRSIVVIILASALAVGCTPAYVSRLVANSDSAVDTSSDLQRLLTKGSDSDIIFVLVNSKDEAVYMPVARYVGNVNRLRNDSLVKSKIPELVAGRGLWISAKILAARGDTEAFGLYLRLFEHLYGADFHGDRIGRARVLSGFTGELLDITGVKFETPEELKRWMEHDLPGLEFDMTQTTSFDHLPSLRARHPAQK